METGLARQEFNRILKIMKDLGYKDSDSLEKFWMNNSYKVNNLAYGNGAYGSFETQIKWHFEDYQVIQKSIVDYLNSKTQQAFIPENYRNRIKIVVDFTDWSYQFEGKTYTSQDYGRLVSTYDDEDDKLYYLFDFSGIDLSEVSVRNCIIKNCYFDSAFFDSALFENVDFEDCMLDYASFHKATLSTVGFVNNTTIRGILLDCAWVENLKNLNHNSLPTSFVYTEVKYKWIIAKLFKSIFYKDGLALSDFRGQNHTTFMNVNVEGLTRSHVKTDIDYINWFQSLTGKLFRFKRLRLKTKIGFVLSCVTTKYWSSFAALGISAFAINILYSIVYFCNNSSYHELSVGTPVEKFIKSFYYSTVTFMTLGYGDVYPENWGGQLIVITEVTLGYIVLGLFVYLVSRKVDKLY
ncbi:MAG: ion channel [Fluviicola sp.]|nr:ion channel [Fluviicola sp.]